MNIVSQSSRNLRKNYLLNIILANRGRDWQMFGGYSSSVFKFGWKHIHGNLYKTTHRMKQSDLPQTWIHFLFIITVIHPSVHISKRFEELVTVCENCILVFCVNLEFITFCVMWFFSYLPITGNNWLASILFETTKLITIIDYITLLFAERNIGFYLCC